MTTIWSYGYINLDIITQPVSHWPGPSGLVWVDNIDFKMGGVALNPAVTVAKLGGLAAGLIGYIGGDAAGQMIKAELEQLGLNTSRLIIDPSRPTGICIVAVHPDAERSFIISAGANAGLQAGNLDVSGLQPGDFFHIGGAISMAGRQTLLSQVRAQEAIVSVDVSFDSSGQWWSRLAPIFSAIDIFMANAFESERLTGASDPTQAARQVSAAGPSLVVIKLGQDGAYVFSSTWEGHLPSFEVEAVDTTGAGDAFAGALLYGLAKGWAIEQAALFANAVGALCTTAGGAAEGLRPYEETVAFIKAQKRADLWNWT